jgi:hypothetical protein
MAHRNGLVKVTGANTMNHTVTLTTTDGQMTGWWVDCTINGCPAAVSQLNGLASESGHLIDVLVRRSTEKR